MKPRTGEKVVFGDGSPLGERVRRGRKAAGRILDSVGTPASYRYSDRSRHSRLIKETRAAERGVVRTSDALRSRLNTQLDAGVKLQAPTKQGGKIVATGINHGRGRYQATTWHLNVESATGKITEFSVSVTSDGGDLYDGTNRANVSVIDPKNDRVHSANSYVGEGTIETYWSAQTALQELDQSHQDGSLIVRPMSPPEASDPQMPPPAQAA